MEEDKRLTDYLSPDEIKKLPNTGLLDELDKVIFTYNYLLYDRIRVIGNCALDGRRPEGWELGGNGNISEESKRVRSYYSSLREELSVRLSNEK